MCPAHSKPCVHHTHVCSVVFYLNYVGSVKDQLRVQDIGSHFVYDLKHLDIGRTLNNVLASIYVPLRTKTAAPLVALLCPRCHHYQNFHQKKKNNENMRTRSWHSEAGTAKLAQRSWHIEAGTAIIYSFQAQVSSIKVCGASTCLTLADK